MIKLLEIKELLVNYYKKFEKFIVPISKFLFAFITLINLNSFIGLNPDLNNGFVSFIVSLIAAFIPATWFVLILMLLVCGHMYMVSIEALLIVAVLMLIIFFMLVRVFPKSAYFVIIVPLAFTFKIGYVVPIFAGLMIGPTAIAAVGAGIAVYKFAPYIQGLTELKSSEFYDMPDTLMKMYNYVMHSLFEDKAMLLMIIVFSLVIVVVYMVTRFSFDYMWYIAIGIGVIVNILGLIIGSVIVSADISIVGVILGSLFAGLLCALCQFMRFSLDYHRTEKVQFEDDDFYYYVKAIPKIKISKAEKEIKKIK